MELILLLNKLLRPLPLAGVIALLLLSSRVSANSGEAVDRVALLSFKAGLTGGVLALSWNETLDFCRWKGITCGGRRYPRRVTALDLGGLYLVGPLSPSLANLTFLTSLRLPGNRLYGSVPAEFGRLSWLQHLDLSSNSLSGEIPGNLSRCSSLRNVTLRGNSLEGEIPGELGSLPELHSLNLALNNLSGHIPPSLGNLSSVTSLILSDNRLKGSIPSKLGDLPNLKKFSIGRNNLSGTIPPSIFNSSTLEIMDANYNQLTGTLPGDIGQTLPRLQWFLVTVNLLEGRIPPTFPNASRLEYLEMKYNMLSGPFPSNLGALQRLSSLMLGGNRLEGGEADGWSFLVSLTNCSSLAVLDMGGNLLRGALPKAVGNLSRLEALQTGAAQISGRIPPEIGNLVNLNLLNMQRNFLTGSIPEAVSRLQHLEKLTFAGNELSGEIPSSIGNLTRLISLSLNVNGIEGNIPTSLANCQSLYILDLSVNDLTGIIPPGILSLPSLSYYLDLSRNSLSGPLLPEVGRLTKLGNLILSDNRLTGEIPSSLGDCTSLENVLMDGNLFQGHLPESLGNLKGLRQMDLSRNNLSGSIPPFFGRLRFLERLNLSFNDFEGEVPRGGVLDDPTAVSVYGNNRLCGGNPMLRLPGCPPAHKRAHTPWKLLAIIVASFMTITLGFLFFLFANRYRKGRMLTQGPETVVSPADQYVKVSYFQLLRATDGFSAENLIGTGSFGSVYKGTLALDHGGDEMAVAVKVLDLQEHGAAKSFAAECEALRSVRHRNLAKIITSCSGVDSKGDDFKALVFEFMPNGSLERWLHPPVPDGTGRVDAPLMRLTFLQRLNVAIDVASALDYLHNYGQTPIVHCDLKPSNILLDRDMNGIVSDFGLATFILQSGRRTPTTGGIKGTIGYIPPECGMTSQASTLGDVYSFGILLLEMFTGKRPTDDTFGEDLSLRKYVEMAFPEEVKSIIDPHLLPHEENEEPNGCDIQELNNVVGRLEEECMTSLFRIGLSCSSESPKDRMEIRDVIKEMHTIKLLYTREMARKALNM